MRFPDIGGVPGAWKRPSDCIGNQAAPVTGDGFAQVVYGLR